eukprot:scaffold46934_cov64-Phaeocystis_antarctica.AAC.1
MALRHTSHCSSCRGPMIPNAKAADGPSRRRRWRSSSAGARAPSRTSGTGPARKSCRRPARRAPRRRRRRTG